MKDPYLMLSVRALDKTRSGWAAAGLLNQRDLLGGLILMWEQCWRRKTLQLKPIEVCAFFDRKDMDQDGQLLIRALSAYGFVTINPDGALMVVDDKDRLGVRRYNNKQAGAAKARALKLAKLGQVDDQSTHQADGGVDYGHDQPLIVPMINAPSTLIEASHTAIKPVKDYVVSTDYDPSLYPEAAEKQTQPTRTQGLAAEEFTPAQPVVNAPRGDHAAREAKPHRDDMTSAADLARRAFKTFSMHAPRPPAAPPSSERPPPASTAPLPTSPAISQPWPPGAIVEKPADAPMAEEDYYVFEP